MERVKIIDYFAVRTFHEVVNYSFVKLCAGIFKQVKYLSGKSANQNMQRMFVQAEEVTPANVRYGVMPNYEPDTPMGARLRDVWGFFLTLYHYVVTSRSTLLFYNYTNKFSLPLILMLNVLLRKKVVFVFHGELEFLVSKVSYLKLSGWYKQSMQFSFRHLFMKSPAYALVLGDSIRKNLTEIFPHLFPHILSICHPYLLNNTDGHRAAREKDAPVRIGTVGTMKESKGLKEFLALSGLLEDLLAQKRLELYSVGRVYAGGIDLGKEINWVGHEKGLPRDEFEKQILRLDYLLYLYPKEPYRFTASGAILDAVKMRKPILSLRNDYFDYLLDGCPIGYMRDTVEDLAKVIRDIVAGKLQEDFSAGFEGLSEKVSLEANARVFENELKRMNCI